jgi:hypothetical protein
MKGTVLSLFGLLILAYPIFAQISPQPVADNEVRDNTSIRMRSIELERIKRDAGKLRPNETSREAEIRFAEVKEDFESIQKLEFSIVKAYTTGAKINYEKIRESTLEMNKRATRLALNLFNTGPDAELAKGTGDLTRKSLRELIIELDRKLSDFVNGALFKNRNVLDAAENAKAEADLKKVVRLCQALNVMAAKLARASG